MMVGAFYLVGLQLREILRLVGVFCQRTGGLEGLLRRRYGEPGPGYE